MSTTDNSALGRAPGLYFGWRVVLAVSLGVAAVIGVDFSSFIMFSVPFSQEFGWSETQTGTLVSAMWLTGPLVLVVSPFVDRLGPWRLLVCGMTIQVIAVAMTTLVQTYEQMVALRLVMGASLVLQASAGPIIIARWFERHFSVAMAITWSAAAGGQIVMSPLTVYLDEAYGWRIAALVLAGLIAIALVIGIALSRCAPSPASLGLRVDGAGPSANVVAEVAPEKRGLKETLASINWWAASLMCFAVFMAGTTSVAFQAEAPAFFAALNMSQSTAAVLISIFASTALVGSIAAGWILDKRRTHVTSLIVAVSVYLGLVALAGVTGASSPLLGGIASGLLGFGLGAGEVLWITLFKRQFGAPAFATTYGIFFCSFQLGMAFGGFAGGATFQALGLFGFVLALLAGYLAPVIVSLWRPGKMVAADATAS